MNQAKLPPSRSYANSRLRQFASDEEEETDKNNNRQTSISKLHSLKKKPIMSSNERTSASTANRNINQMKRSPSNKFGLSKPSRFSSLKSASSRSRPKNPDLIKTVIDKKDYYHMPSFDLEKMCHNLPNENDRHEFQVTEIEDYLFYHDFDLELTDSTDLITHLNQLKNISIEVSDFVKKEYRLKLIRSYDISFENRKEVLENSIKWMDDRLHYKCLDLSKATTKKTELEPPSKSTGKDSDSDGDDSETAFTGKMASDHLTWDLDAWVRASVKKYQGHNKMKTSLTSQEVSSSKTEPDLLEKFENLEINRPKSPELSLTIQSANPCEEASNADNSCPKKLPVVEGKMKNMILSYLGTSADKMKQMNLPKRNENESSEKNPIESNSSRSSSSKIRNLGRERPNPLDRFIEEDNLCQEYLNKPSVSPSKDKNKSISRIRKVVEDHRRTKLERINRESAPLRALDLSVSMSQAKLVSRKRSIECCDPQFLDKGIHSSSIKNELKSLFEKKSLNWRQYSKNLVDSHCHFEMLFHKMRYKKTVGEYFKEFESIYLENFEACVNVICDPSKYNNQYRLDETLRIVNHPKVFSTIGCHPHFADLWSSDIEKLVRSVLNNPRIVAIGECGLDSSRKNNVYESVQIATFKAQLQLAYETKKPLVIHCRDFELEVYQIMKKYLDPDHKIHLHCFTGGWKIGEKYLDHFPNLCIGVTPLITYSHTRGVKELIQNIPLDRLLLETDAPYFVPQTHEFPSGVEASHPAFIFATVESVARVKGISVNQVLKANRENVKKIYGF